MLTWPFAVSSAPLGSSAPEMEFSGIGGGLDGNGHEK